MLLPNPAAGVFRASRRIVPTTWCRGTGFIPLCLTDVKAPDSLRRSICKSIYEPARRGCRRAEHGRCGCPSALRGAEQERARPSAVPVSRVPSLPSLVTRCAQRVPAGTAGPSGHLLSSRDSRDHHGPKSNQQQQLCLRPRFLAVVI